MRRTNALVYPVSVYDKSIPFFCFFFLFFSLVISLNTFFDIFCVIMICRPFKIVIIDYRLSMTLLFLMLYSILLHPCVCVDIHNTFSPSFPMKIDWGSFRNWQRLKSTKSSPIIRMTCPHINKRLS